MKLYLCDTDFGGRISSEVRYPDRKRDVHDMIQPFIITKSTIDIAEDMKRTVVTKKVYCIDHGDVYDLQKCFAQLVKHHSYMRESVETFMDTGLQRSVMFELLIEEPKDEVTPW